MSLDKSQELKKISELCPSWIYKKIDFRKNSKWPLFNPSVLVDGDEFLAVVRTANYRLISHNLHPITDDPLNPYTGLIRTRNYLIRLSHQFELVEEPIPMSLSPNFSEPSWEDHLEDLRLFVIDGELYAIAALYEHREDRSSIKIVSIDREGKISQAFNVPSPFGRQKEKNWIPIYKNNLLHLIHTCSPTIVVTVDIKANTMTTWQSGSGIAELNGWSGSSQGCAVGDWTLCVVHKRTLANTGLSYPHRFVMFDAELRVCAISDKFVFHHDGVEFCAGLAKREDQLVLSYGVNDGEAMIGSMSLYDALNTLRWRAPS